MTGSIDGRDQQLALLITVAWREEIEQAINRVKKPVNRAELGRWFRKQWYRTEARRKKEHHMESHRANRRQIGGHGGDENGNGSGRC